MQTTKKKERKFPAEIYMLLDCCMFEDFPNGICLIPFASMQEQLTVGQVKRKLSISIESSGSMQYIVCKHDRRRWLA